MVFLSGKYIKTRYPIIPFIRKTGIHNTHDFFSSHYWPFQPLMTYCMACALGNKSLFDSFLLPGILLNMSHGIILKNNLKLKKIISFTNKKHFPPTKKQTVILYCFNSFSHHRAIGDYWQQFFPFSFLFRGCVWNPFLYKALIVRVK